MKETYLEHHGIKGQKWGVRRYQNPDGTLTEEGKRRKSKAGTSSKEDVKNYVNNLLIKNKKQASAGSFFNDKKYRNEDGSLNDEGKRRKSKGKQYTEDYWNAHDKKDTKYMSDRELQQRIQRLNNEQQYKNLTKSAARKKGEKFANDLVDKAVLAIVVGAAAQATRKYAPKGIKYVKNRLKNKG